MTKILGTISGAALWLSAAVLPAQSFVNGSLTGPIVNDGVPPGWQTLIGSPDTVDPSNNVGVPGQGFFGATPSVSPDGGTWVGLGREANFFFERFGQTVNGLTVGQTYQISWYASNFGYTQFDYIQPNFIEVFATGISIGRGATRAMSTGWEQQSISFVATSTSSVISFQLGGTGKAYMGIDGITFGPSVVVPEPSTVALLASGLIGVVVMARRRVRG